MWLQTEVSFFLIIYASTNIMECSTAFSVHCNHHIAIISTQNNHTPIDYSDTHLIYIYIYISHNNFLELDGNFIYLFIITMEVAPSKLWGAHTQR